MRPRVQPDSGEAVLLAAGEGEAVTEEAERTVAIKTAHPLLDVTWSRYEPGERGPGPHVHERHVDAFFVLCGELLFELGGERSRLPVTAGAGTLVAVPPGIVHTFGNEGGGTATFLNLHAPSCGFADSLRGRDVAFDSVDPPPGGGRDPREAVVCRLDEAERHERGRVANTILLELEQLSLNVVDCGPGFAVAPHAHEDHLDAFFVLDGSARFRVGGREEQAALGSWAAAPPGVTHGFAIAGAGRARLLNVHAPDAGFIASLRRRFSSAPAS